MEKEKDNIGKLADAWRTRAAGLADEPDRLECLLLIDEWEGMRRAVSALSSAADVTSYSIGGRSVTRADLRTLRRDAQAAEDQIRAKLGTGGGVLVADLRGAFA